MACETSTGQCLATHLGGEFPVCCPPFDELFEFTRTDTASRFPGCWTGIINTGGSQPNEIRDGHTCGMGCQGSAQDETSCDDAALERIADSLDGKRWLRLDPSALNLDAYGRFHDLRSEDEFNYHPVPRETNYLRGTCWYNDGRECFGPDVCGCWAKGTRFPENGLCQPGGKREGESLEQIFPDTSFRLGYRWPPDHRPGNSNVTSQEDFYCRKFADTRIGQAVTRTTLTAAAFGGLPGIVEPNLSPIGASFSVCSPNVLVFLAANIAKPAVSGAAEGEASCEKSLWYIRPPGQTPGRHYNLAFSRNRFDELRLSNFSPNDDRPRINVCDAGTPLQQATAEIKNRVLDAVLGQQFGDVRFDRLDHQQIPDGNRSLGYYLRAFEAEPGVEIPGVYGQCRLAKSGCPVTCRLNIVEIHVSAYVVLLYLRRTMQTPLLRHVEPHIRFLIAIRTETTATLEGGECFLDAWDGSRRRLTLDGLSVTPPVDEIEFRDTQGRIVMPPSIVEWRGFLGEHSVPKAQRDFRRVVDLRLSVSSEVASRMQGIDVPGWPMLAESRPDAPEGIYRGKVVVGFGI